MMVTLSFNEVVSVVLASFDVLYNVCDVYAARDN